VYRVIFYSNERGHSVEDYINQLKLKADNDKYCRIKLRKIIAYIDKLEEHGTFLGEPFVKRLDDTLWELRPIKDRIIFASISDKRIILLHIFSKKTKKTPKREIRIVYNHLNDFLERDNNEDLG